MNDSLVIFLVILAAGIGVLLVYAAFNPSQLARIRQRQPERDVEDIRTGSTVQDSYMLEVRRKNQQDIIRYNGIRGGASDPRLHDAHHSYGYHSSSGMVTPGSIQYTPGPNDPTPYDEQAYAPHPSHPSPSGKASYFVQTANVAGP